MISAMRLCRAGRGIASTFSRDVASPVAASGTVCPRQNRRAPPKTTRARPACPGRLRQIAVSLGSAAGLYPGSMADFGKGGAMTGTDEKTTHFGFRDIPEGEKAGMVHGVFSRVASKYDIMNDLMSVGIHRLWKDAMMDWLNPRPGQRLLDVAGGTGDIAFRFLKRAPEHRPSSAT
jgi:hypothetical protein